MKLSLMAQQEQRFGPTSLRAFLQSSTSAGKDIAVRIRASLLFFLRLVKLELSLCPGFDGRMSACNIFASI
jgi:hypothetical protein